MTGREAGHSELGFRDGDCSTPPCVCDFHWEAAIGIKEPGAMHLCEGDQGISMES